MGGGKKKKTTKKKKQYSKAQMMAKKRIQDKQNQPKNLKSTNNKYTKAQLMAQKRIAEGKTISQVKAANVASMKQKAKDRHAKFKQTKVQTFGGTKTSYSKAEQERIKDAGYKVAGYSKAPAQSDTQLQVNKDNLMYGNTFPSGGLNISEEGQALAKQNKAQAQTAANVKYNTGNLLALNAGPSSPIKFYEGLGYRYYGGAGYPTSDMNKIRFKQPVLPPMPKASAELGGNLIASSDLSGLSIGDPKQTKFTPTMPGLAKSLGIDTESTKDFSSLVGIKSPSTYGYPSSEAVDKAISSGGLNIGDSGFIASKDTEVSKTGRTLNQKLKNLATFASNLVQQPKALAAYGTDVAKQLFSPSLADGTLTGNTDFAGNLPGDAGFDNRDVQIKGAFNNAMNSNFVQQYGENLGLPKDFKAQTKGLVSALADNYKGATADRDGIYAGTSETLKTLSSNEKLAPLAKYLNQLGSDNENVLDSDRNKKFSMMGFETPLSNEMAADIITSFQPNVDKMQGLSRKDRGLIEGGAGNLLVSGKLTDIAREALIGDKGSGETLGLDKGSPLTIGNMIDASNLISSNLKDSKTLASKRSQEIANLANKAGKITTPSLIKGIIPKFGGSGSYRPNAVSSLGKGAATLAATPPASVEEILPLPTTKALGGTNATDLSGLQKQAYANQMSLYGMNPNYFATIMQPKFTAPKKKFSQYFNRDYIPKFA